MGYFLGNFGESQFTYGGSCSMGGYARKILAQVPQNPAFWGIFWGRK
ncbi:hypothetical protein HKBW3S03_01732, partial [Candidatus Hakubella thermalkaliphila]